jgi:hypothetical protein
MFDDDMLLPTEMFERLYAHQKDIVAPLAFTRLKPFRPVIYNLTQGWDALERKEYYLNEAVLTYPKDTLVECDAVGFGAVLINTDVFKTVPKQWFMTTSGAGEDIHFCHRAKKSGCHVFMDTSVKLGHLGEPLVSTEETYEAEENMAELRKVYGETKKYST